MKNFTCRLAWVLVIAMVVVSFPSRMTHAAESEEVIAPDEWYESELLEGSGDISFLDEHRVFYSQPEFYVAEAYDAIQFFITERGKYVAKGYLIVSDNSSWRLYDYTDQSAIRYFTRTHNRNEKMRNIPLEKAFDRRDNFLTPSINERCVPIITMADFKAMGYNWRSFEEVPFSKDENGRLEYAYYWLSDPNPSTWSPASYYRYTVSLNGSQNLYRIYVTKNVSYNGKYHVTRETRLNWKRSQDLEVFIYLNGELVDPSLYRLTFKNNRNVGHHDGTLNVPMFRINFRFKKKSLKSDVKAFRYKAFGFNIDPMDLNEGWLDVNRKRSGRLKVRFTLDGTSILRLSPNKDYIVSCDNKGVLSLTGIGNFTGTVRIPLNLLKGGET